MYLTANEDVFDTQFTDKECVLTIRSDGPTIEIFGNSQEIAQIGMSLLIDAVEVGIDDMDSFVEMIDGMGIDATDKMKKFLKEVLNALEE